MTGVHPDYRSMGLGRAVVAAGMEYLKAKEVDGIELEVDSENAPARTMYLSLGFRKIGQTQWYEKRLA
jgi:ribosomal protein S18 acetylase RimI-like enzyme